MLRKPDAQSREANQSPDKRKRGSLARALGLGIVTGAADDDCSAIGTYASAGAQFGTSLLWTAPVTFPMMFAVVYLSAKLGQVAGKGLFGVIRDHYPRWLLHSILIGVLIGNTIEAGADIGGMAAAIRTGGRPSCSDVIFCRLPNRTFDAVSEPVRATPSHPSKVPKKG